VQTLVTEIRRFRADQGLPPSKRVPARLVGGNDQVNSFAASLTKLTAAEDGFAATASIEAALAHASVHVELDTSSTIDVAAEIARSEKDVAVARKEAQDTAARLGNESFMAKAPAPVVDKIRARAAKAAADIDRLTARLTTLRGGQN
jgi:valyl-tRNA synthetase